jgi:hypothetical protein
MIRRLATVCACFVLSTAFAAAPVAFVTDIQGGATIAGNGKVAFLGELVAATRLVLDKGAKVGVMYSASGTEFTMAGPGEFLIDTTEAKAIKGTAPARRNVAQLADPGVVARVSQSATASLRMRSLSGAIAAKPGPAYPRNAQIATLMPNFRWVGEPGAKGFTVVVSASDGKEVGKGTSRVNTLHLASMRLSPATRYSWTVSADGKALGEALFETLPAETIARAEKSRAAAKTFPDRVLHAFVLTDVGATQDAREAWASLARERPDIPELAVLAR